MTPPVRMSLDQHRVAENETLKRANRKLEDDVARLEEKVAILTADDDTVEKKYDSLERQIIAKDVRINQLLEDNRRLQATVNYLKPKRSKK